MAKSVSCRYCGEPFVPKPGKPGFVDECPECLYAKTAPTIPPEKQFVARLRESSSESKKALKAFRRSLLQVSGIDESNVDKIIADVFEMAARQKSATQI